MDELSCRSCHSASLKSFVDLGNSPLANAYLEQSQLWRAEKFYPLHVFICSKCLLVQLPQFHAPQEIFEEYAYFSSWSDSWLAHAKKYVNFMMSEFGVSDRRQVVEVASNDGYLLQYFHQAGVPVLGVEPAQNVARAAIEKGVPTLSEFFGERLARRLVKEGKQADLLIGNNVLAHVPELNDFVSGLKILLKRTGVITLEFPHLLRLMLENQFDTIYHEHFSYFSLHAVKSVFANHGLTIFDVQELPTHGGSLRLFVTHENAVTSESFPRRRDSSHTAPLLDSRLRGNDGLNDPFFEGEKLVGGRENVANVLKKEIEAGLTNLEAYENFSEQVRETKRALLDCLISLKRDGKSIAGYGAPAKGNTLLNYCGVSTDFIDYTVDRSPVKQNRFLPGTRIPIFAPERLQETKPDFVLILPWNIKNEIMEQTAHIRDWGGRFITPIPKPEIHP